MMAFFNTGLLLVVLWASTVDAATQNNAPWGLARCSQPNPLGRPPHQYKYSANTNQEVTVYVLDTGITPTHTDFEGRARVGPQFIHRNEAECDLNGHGTHVAGTIAGKRYGICKTCKLVGVKVLDGQGYGSTPNSVNGIRWVMRDCRDPFKCIINMSLGGRADPAMDRAVSEAVNRGIAVIVAAGNEKQDACNVSPGGARDAYTVASSTNRDVLSDFSNHGSCVNIIAPGSDILSAMKPRDPVAACRNRTPVSDFQEISGTSMAAPHVAGIAAYLRATGQGGRTVQDLYRKLDSLVVQNKVSGMRGRTKNWLTQNGYTGN